MRKLFILLSVLALSITAHADVINIDTETANALRLALSTAPNGAEIVMDGGTYVETGAWIAIEDKEVTIRAKEGETVIIKPQYSVRVKAGTTNQVGKAEFIGVKFDCSVLESSELFVPSDDKANQKVILDNCELYNWSNNRALIHSTSERRLDVIDIRNCYFHDFEKSIVFVENANLVSLSITNSTFANVAGVAEYYAAPIDVRATTGTVLVDHCTFYNVKAMSSSYGIINVNNISAVTISNSIFAQPSTVNHYAVACVAGSTIDYCLAYKTNGFSQASTHDRSGNPYFMNTNPANYDFTIWTTSPAHGTADDGYDLGDYLRWDTDPATHVATINITADDANSLKAAVDAALPGDEIVLAAGTYEESESISLDKEITIKAADGASPIVKPVGNFAISNGVEVTIQNIKFDGSDQSGVSNFIYAADNEANDLTVEGCEFYSFSNKVIYAASDNKLACTVEDCYFRSNTNLCIYIENTVAANLKISNSTFADINATGISAGVVDTKTASGVVRVDHCTFYDCKAKNTDYGVIGHNGSFTSDFTVSNCIFAWGTTYDKRATYLPAGTAVTNCLTYNTSKDTEYWGHHSGPTFTNCTLKDPLFNDLVNNNYTYDANWSTGSISPAFGTATDGTNLGDPRWDSDNEVIPSSSIASSYDLLPTKAQLTGDVELNASNHIKYKGTATPGTAKWKLHVDRACMINAVVDQETGNTSGCQYTLTVKDADGNTVAAPAQPSATYNADDINLPGTITISAAGDYTFILTNSKSSSASALDKIILSYFGGAVQTIATDANTTLNVTDAWFSGCTRDNDKTYIQYPSSETSSAWIKWNIATSETKYYDLTVNVNTEYNHGFTAAIYEDEEAEPVTSVTEGSFVETKGVLALELGRVNLVGGKNYVVKVTNAPSGSQAKVTSVVFVPVVATATELPNTLAFSNAVLSEKARIIDGMIYFNEIGDTDPRGQWAQWEVTTNHNGLFLFTMGVTSDNDQTYKITILNSGAEELDFFEKGFGNGAQTIKHYFALAQGTYFVKVENTKSYSHGHLTSLVVTEPNDVVTLDEAATDNTSWADKVVAKEAEGPLYDVRIIRTIKAGMYNTICLPFEVSTSQCREIFGADVQLRTLGTATLEEGDFVLNLNFDVANDIYPGTPLLIKTSRDIVNPVFAGVKFTTETPGSTTRTNAKFKGNFVKGTIPADENNLFLGASNTLYFPTVDMEILGMRAYFEVIAPAGAVKRARIIEREQIITDVELVAEQPNAKSQKILRDGQLIIIRDGNMYNVMGAKLQ